MPSRQLRQLPPAAAAAAAAAPDLSIPDPAAAAKVGETQSNNRHSSVIHAVITTGICLLIVLFAAAAFLLYRVGRRRRSALQETADLVGVAVAKGDQDRAETSSASPLKEPERFSYEELRSATASFALFNKLGQGGFGPVFRGVLRDGREIAVKVMEDGSLQGEREFRNELALATSIMQGGDDNLNSSRFVVFCIGFCSDDDDGSGLASSRKGRSKRKKKRKKKSTRVEETDKWGIWGRKSSRSISSAFTEDEEGDISICEGQESGRRLLLVYELMRNGSLQDALLDRRCPELKEWSKRFSIALDVAKGIEFLHSACDPPVIHGDIKPSNILLDANFSAKIGDFGLARILIPSVIPPLGDDASVTVVDDISVTVAETESVGTTTIDEMGHYPNTPLRGIGSRAHGTAALAISKESPELEVEIGNSMRMSETDGASPMAMAVERTIEAGSTSELGGAYDKMSVDSGAELLTPGGKRWWKKNGSESHGRDWWWRQDTLPSNSEKPDFSGRSTVKDYVMEWIGSELRKERPKAAWEDASSSNLDSEHALPPKKPDRKKHHKRLDWWARKKGKNRPAREWWREEFCEELTRKNNNKKKQDAIKFNASNSAVEKGKQWWETDDDGEELSFRKKSRKAWSRGSRSSVERGVDAFSGDIPKSGGISSTPSMRGTVCYAAPEYGGGGLLSEKCDIYSFGVLLLVLISGRRPLQVTASPMADFERANLISWTRHLAHAGKLTDLIDASLQSVNKDQALLCITIALLCLQRSPARRPMIKEVVGMLSGESETPHLPVEFSPSPPGFPYKSHRRAR